MRIMREGLATIVRSVHKTGHFGEVAWVGSDCGGRSPRYEAHHAEPDGYYRTAPSTERLALSSLSKLVTRASVVSRRAAILAALERAVRTTLTGSMMPALYIST